MMKCTFNPGTISRLPAQDAKAASKLCSDRRASGPRERALDMSIEPHPDAGLSFDADAIDTVPSGRIAGVIGRGAGGVWTGADLVRRFLLWLRAGPMRRRVGCEVRVPGRRAGRAS